jgi:hypothetical protein
MDWQALLEQLAQISPSPCMNNDAWDSQDETAPHWSSPSPQQAKIGAKILTCATPLTPPPFQLTRSLTPTCTQPKRASSSNSSNTTELWEPTLHSGQPSPPMRCFGHTSLLISAPPSKLSITAKDTSLQDI